MKTTICLTVLLLFFLSMKPARFKTLYESKAIEKMENGNNYLYVDIDSINFTIFRQIIWIEPDEKRRRYNDSIDRIWHHMRTSATHILSEGTVKVKNNKIICYAPQLKRYYTFRQINDSTIVATKHTALFVKGDTLKITFNY